MGEVCLLQQSFCPSSCFSFPCQPFRSPFSHCLYVFRAFLFPPPPLPLCWGLPRKAEPGCDIVCHCGITALASRQKTCRRHGGGDLRCTRSVLPRGSQTLQRGKKNRFTERKRNSVNPKLILSSKIASCQISLI